MRLIHTADWQIGRVYHQFDPEDAALLAEARLAAVERVAQLALAEGAELVLVAGDVFDTQHVAERWLRRLFAALREFPGPWILLPGNHDAALAESPWTRARALGIVPPEVHLALEPAPILLERLKVAVLPAPLTQRRTHLDVSHWFDACETPPDFIRLGLAHGSVTGLLEFAELGGNPIAADRAERARLDYLALGDWHGTRQVDARTWYSGTPEPDRFRDNGAGNVLLVEIDAPGAEPRITPHVTARYQWHEQQRRLLAATDVAVLAAELAALPAAAVMKLELSGSLDLASCAVLDEALAATAARLRALRLERGELRLAPTAEDLANLSVRGYVADALQILRARQEEPDGAVAGRAIALLAELLRTAPGSAP